MNKGNLLNFSNYQNKGENPFFINKPQTQENLTKQDYDLFNKNDPFSQQNISPLSYINNIIQNNIQSSNKSNDNSQKKYVNNEENDIYTPGANNKPNDINTFANFNNRSNMFLEEDKNNNHNIFHTNEIYQNINRNSPNLNLSGFNTDIDSNKMIFFGKKIMNDCDNNKEKLPLSIYDNQTNELNINNLNEMIEKSEIENNIKKKGLLSTSINSNLDIIKEEQNESDKKSENEIKKNSFNKYNPNQIINKFKSNNNKNNNINELISIEQLINESINEEELNKFVTENNDHVDSLLTEYNNYIINDIIDLDINLFKNEINIFIHNSIITIDKLKTLDDICDKIKEKIMLNYEIQQKIQENKINEYQKLKEYEEKLDYIIMFQNKLIKELDNINAQIIKDLNVQESKKEKIFDENNINNNIDKTMINLEKINYLINNHFYCDKELNIIESNDIHIINNINENILFFEIAENIYNQIKEINSIYQQILFKIFKNKKE